MNAPIRRLAMVVFLMFAALLVSTTYLQFVQADELSERSDNRRTLLDTYSRDRGAILVDGAAIAQTDPTNDSLQRIRSYPQGPLYSHVTGYFSFTYGAGGGLEGARNSVLSGTDDLLFTPTLLLPQAQPSQQLVTESVDLGLTPRTQRDGSTGTAR